MGLTKGFIDERDNFRYIFKKTEIEVNELSGFIFSIHFKYYNLNDEYINDYILALPGQSGLDLYNSWEDLRDLYQMLINEFDIQLELPESMDNELDPS